MVGACFALTPLGLAQVSVEVALDQDQFLAGESLEVGVRITNFSGQTLHLGKDKDWLRFNLEGKDNYVVPMTGDVPVEGEFDVDSSTVVTRRVDLAPSFALTRPGRYTVTATVRIKELDREFLGKPKPFDVIAGTKLWEQDVGVPGPAGQPTEVRKYALQQAIHLKQLRLYVRVSDAAETRIFRVFPVGPLISFSQPEHQIDPSSNLHLLYQTGARSFNYSVVNPDGRLLVRQTYDYTETRPGLRVDREGRIFISGGVRRPAQDDLPPPSDASTHESRTPKP
jgi:hypothetical protein